MEAVPHPFFLEALFTFKCKVSNIFREILGLHEINHIAITRINAKQEILTFSSTPALEFNLFNTNLWHFDKTYQKNWFQTLSQATWHSLYTAERYDELYYLKQIKHNYSLGYSLSARIEDIFFIYSFASMQFSSSTKEQFANNPDNFYKMGQYCTNQLIPLFTHYDNQST